MNDAQITAAHDFAAELVDAFDEYNEACHLHRHHGTDIAHMLVTKRARLRGKIAAMLVRCGMKP